MNIRAGARAPIRSRQRIVAISAGVVALAVFVAANVHLVAVSFSSQPDCVPHLKAPAAGTAQFRAAKSSC